MVSFCFMSARNTQLQSVADPGGLWRPGAPLPPKMSSKSCSFPAILREKTLFWANFGLRAPLGSKLHWAPLTKILDPRLTIQPRQYQTKTDASLLFEGLHGHSLRPVLPPIFRKRQFFTKANSQKSCKAQTSIEAVISKVSKRTQ